MKTQNKPQKLRQMKAENYLEELKRMEKAVDAAKLKVAALESSVTYASQNYGYKADGGNKCDSSYAIVNLIQAKAECDAAINRCTEYRVECIRRINMLENKTYVHLLMLRYVSHKSWFVVSQEMHYSIDHMFKLRNHALIEFEGILNQMSDGKHNSK